MTLIEIVTIYVASQRSLGMRFITNDTTYFQQEPARGSETFQCPMFSRQPSQRFFKDMVRSPPHGEHSNTRCCQVLYQFAVGRGYCADVPTSGERTKLPPSRTPYVYSTEELRRLLEATSTLYDYRSRRQASMFRTLLLLLYGSGLRVGEGLRLTIADVDLDGPRRHGA